MKKVMFAVMVSAIVGGLGASAAFAGAADDVKAAVVKSVDGKAKVGDVRESPIKGLWEAVVGGRIVYVDPSAKYVLVGGQMFDPKAGKNLTAEREQEISKIDFSTLPLGKAIKEVKGNGKRALAVFADPNCGYCKRFEKDTLSELKDVTIYHFPVAILGPGSETKAKSAMCAKDKLTAWRKVIAGESLDEVTPCEDARLVDENTRLFKELGATGTPTSFSRDGVRIVGAQGRDSIESLLK